MPDNKDYSLEALNELFNKSKNDLKALSKESPDTLVDEGKLDNEEVLGAKETEKTAQNTQQRGPVFEPEKDVPEAKEAAGTVQNTQWPKLVVETEKKVPEAKETEKPVQNTQQPESVAEPEKKAPEAKETEKSVQNTQQPKPAAEPEKNAPEAKETEKPSQNTQRPKPVAEPEKKVPGAKETEKAVQNAQRLKPVSELEKEKVITTDDRMTQQQKKTGKGKGIIIVLVLAVLAGLAAWWYVNDGSVKKNSETPAQEAASETPAETTKDKEDTQEEAEVTPEVTEPAKTEQESALTEEEQANWNNLEVDGQKVYVELNTRVALVNNKDAYIRLTNPIYSAFYETVRIFDESGSEYYQSEKLAPGTILEAAELSQEVTDPSKQVTVEYTFYDAMGNIKGTHSVTIELVQSTDGNL